MVADLEDKDIIGYMNLGSGLVESGVNKLDGLMLFENEYDEEVSCMIAIDFSRYLLKREFVYRMSPHLRFNLVYMMLPEQNLILRGIIRNVPLFLLRR